MLGYDDAIAEGGEELCEMQSEGWFMEGGELVRKEVDRLRLIIDY